MFKIIGFIPQTSQGLFSHEDKTFAINPPFKKFSVISIQKSQINDSLPYVKEYAYYEELENVFQHFENMHLLEILNNEKLISTLKNQLEAIEKKNVIELKNKIESQELIFNEKLTLLSNANLSLKVKINRLMGRSIRRKRIEKLVRPASKTKVDRISKQSKVAPKTIRKSNN